MATKEPTNATEQSSNSAKIVDASLWWEPFNTFLTELENASVSSEIPRIWLPNQKSREALDSPCVKIGPCELNVQPELKDAALKISSILCLDEVQSYILVKRSMERENAAVNDLHSNILNLILMKDKKCILQLLLSCFHANVSEVLLAEMNIRCINACRLLGFLHNHSINTDFTPILLTVKMTKIEVMLLQTMLHFGSQSEGGSAVLKEAQRLISDGLECKLLSIFQDLLCSNYPEQMDFDLYTLWAEETLIEDNLILDILFLVYYESFCTCDAKSWRTLCGLYEGIVTGSYNFQKLAISPDAIRAIYHAKVQLLFILIEALNLENLLQMVHDNIPFRQGSIGFSESDVQQMDRMISSFNAFEAKEEGPLILAWAVFLCLISSLPEKEENNLLMEIEHVGYVRQAFEASSLGYFLEILQSDTLKYSDGPLAGYRSVLRTFISAFIASYEISLQESLCIQFWDRDSFIDGPVRCLLCNLEGEFLSGLLNFCDLLSRFNFLDKSVGLSTPIGISGHSIVDVVSKIVETRSRCMFLVLKACSLFMAAAQWIHGYATLRLLYTESGVLVLLLRLAQAVYMKNSEELIVILGLLSRLVTFNAAVCYSLANAWNSFHDEELTMGKQEKYVRIDVVEIVCALVKSFSPSVNGAVMMSMGVNILTKMLRCLPSRVATMAMKGNIFDVALRTNPFDIDSTVYQVLDFTMNLLETGLETDTVLALIVFSLQYVLVNHEFWKYRVKRARGNHEEMYFVDLVLPKTGEVVRDIMLCDSSIHSALFRIVCTTTPSLEFFLLSLFPSALNQQKLYVSRLFDIPDIEGLQLAISSGLDVFVSMMSAFSKNIQIGAARLLSVIFIADFSQFNASLSLDDKEVADFRKSIFSILSEQPPWNEDLIVSTLNLLASAARNQPAFLTAVITSKEYLKAQGYNANSEHRPNKTENGSLDSKEESLLHAILQYLRKSEDLFHRKPNILLCLLNFLRALWQGAPQFTKTLEQLKVSDKFWRHLTNIVVLFSDDQDNLSEKFTDKKLQNVAYRYQFLSNVLDILGYEVFLQKKLMHAELVVNRISKSPTNGTEKKLIQKMKVAASLFAVHAMVKIRSGDSGSFSVSLIERVVTLSQKDAPVLALQCLYSNIFALSFRFAISFDLGDFWCSRLQLCKLPAFSNCQLSMQSEVTERVTWFHSCLSVVISSVDHVIGVSCGGQELENLILSDLFYHIQGELEGRQIDNRPFKELLQFLLDSKFLDAYRYKQDDDLLPNIKSVYLYNTARLRADMGLEMWDLLAWKESKEVAETMLLCLQDSNSRMLHSNSKLSALRGLITLLYMHEDNLTEDEASTGLKISEPVVVSCIDHICSSLRATIDLLTPIPDASEDVLDILIAQAELLLLLVRSLSNNCSQPTCVLILKTSGCGLKVLCSCRQALAVETAMNFFLKLIIGSVELTFKDLHSDIVTPIEDVESSAEASNSCLGLLPVLCNCIEHPDHCTLSLAAIDLILQGFSTPSSWFPIIHKHLPLQHIVQKLQERTLSKTVSVILKFLLNLARVRQGAEMLLNAGILASLRMLLSDFSEAIIQSLGDSSSAANIVDYVMAYILVEKAPLISYYLSARIFQLMDMKINALENLAKYGISVKGKSIHLLAFISRATQRPGESLRRDAPLLCHPVLKEEFEWYKKKSFINCRNGWFALSALGCKSNLNLGSSAFEPLPCAARKAEEVGFVDIAHFPELPMPDILHGLQDQGIAIITELCEANKTKQLAPEIQEVCLLLLQITVMALYLEFCVIQICGIRPVLGHVETFSKELRLLIRATEGHVFLKEPLKALKQIVSFVYPELVQQEDLF
ncbi:hypothetical protein DH2020_029631 [Rehmannia glutinosa]|uniref:Uncharacterized protein n=1 Tax=Rehmannia glutinosa TaxID=99300 RepID=A0ABR0VMX2_REHGL